jgi:hypothetical protein
MSSAKKPPFRKIEKRGLTRDEATTRPRKSKAASQTGWESATAAARTPESPASAAAGPRTKNQVSVPTESMTAPASRALTSVILRVVSATRCSIAPTSKG